MWKEAIKYFGNTRTLTFCYVWLLLADLSAVSAQTPHPSGLDRHMCHSQPDALILALASHMWWVWCYPQICEEVVLLLQQTSWVIILALYFNCLTKRMRQRGDAIQPGDRHIAPWLIMRCKKETNISFSLTTSFFVAEHERKCLFIILFWFN